MPKQLVVTITVPLPEGDILVESEAITACAAVIRTAQDGLQSQSKTATVHHVVETVRAPRKDRGQARRKRPETPTGEAGPVAPIIEEAA